MRLPKWPERSRAALYIALIFLCGIVTGALASNVWMNWGPPRSRSARADAPRTRQRTVDRVKRKLSLTPEQAQKLDRIVEETRTAYQVHENEIGAIRQQGRDRIREILTDEQKAKYEQIIARIDARRKKHRR